MEDSIAHPGGLSPAFASLLPPINLNLHIEWPAELPDVIVIDSPAEWGFLIFFAVWLLSRRE